MGEYLSCFGLPVVVTNHAADIYSWVLYNLWSKEIMGYVGPSNEGFIIEKVTQVTLKLNASILQSIRESSFPVLGELGSVSDTLRDIEGGRTCLACSMTAGRS